MRAVAPYPRPTSSGPPIQANIRHQRDAGALSAVGAEDAMSRKYRELYGSDPVMEGVFAYGRYLYTSADAGTLKLKEVDILVEARMREVAQRRRARRQYQEELESEYPPLDLKDYE